jgi:mono/diheme cytochrome c family protein
VSLPSQVGVFSVLFTLATSGAAQSADTVEWNRDVRPILADNCFVCHGPDKGRRKAKLRLDLAASALAEREGRFAIKPGDPARSELVRRIHAQGTKDLMPPAKSHKILTPQQIDLLTKWVSQGARYEPHWAYALPKRRELPAVRNAGWCRNFIDRWVLFRLAREGLRPAAATDRVSLIRRVTFDILGLPPQPDEIRAFVKDPGDGAFERVVDRLLASKHYGERMAMYWLDLVRFADTVGYHGDQVHPIAPYRDWVIDAFNANMRFDQFTIEQLAGDLLPDATTAQKIATGYNRLLQTTHEGGAQPKEYLAIYAADRVRNFGSVWLGGTIGCAQCHDHKFDPYSTRDFYSLAAFFADVQELGDFKGSPNSNPTTRPPELLLLSAADQRELDAVDAQIEAAARGAKKRRRALQKKRKAIAARGRRTMVTVAATPRVTRVLPRGNWLDETGEVVTPAVPHFLRQIDTGGRRATRLDLARWLMAKDHPKTARVFVNRLWYLFFGKGLSSRLMDLGAQGEPPVHPELLDALALEFTRSGWDMKHMVRLIVTSSAYRQSSATSAALRERDPDNRLIARQSRWRLPAEMVRDNALSISGLLVPTIGGDSIKPYQPAGYYQHLNFPQRKYRHHTDARQWRRGVYVHWQRQFLHPALLAFDAPTREECTAERAVSNTPQAALTLLNDPTFVEAARALGVRMLAAREIPSASNDDCRLRHGFRLATSRLPVELEMVPLRALLQRHRRAYRGDPTAATKLSKIGGWVIPRGTDPVELAAWTSVARVLLNLNETTTRN